MRLKARQVEAFRSVMASGGITTAAEAMNITQPAVSRLIKDLESAVRLRLFERRGTRLSPTPEAVLLFREVERFYLGLDQIARAADDIGQHKNIVLRIASVTSLVRPYLQQAILDVLGNRLDLPLVIDVENSRHISEMVEKGQYDLGLVFDSQGAPERSATLLQTSEAVAVVTPGHDLAGLDQVRTPDLQHHRILVPGRNSPLRLALDRTFAVEHLHPATIVETSMLNCCCFAAAGFGIAIVDRISVRAAGADVVTIPFVPEIRVSYLAIRPPGARRIAALDDIVSRMQALMQRDQSLAAGRPPRHRLAPHPATPAPGGRHRTARRRPAR